jgi:hypothetical protein
MSNSLDKKLGKNIIEFNEEFIINNNFKLADENIRKRLFNTIDKINSSVVNNFKSLNFFLKFVFLFTFCLFEVRAHVRAGALRPLPFAYCLFTQLPLALVFGLPMGG